MSRQLAKAVAMVATSSSAVEIQDPCASPLASEHQRCSHEGVATIARDLPVLRPPPRSLRKSLSWKTKLTAEETWASPMFTRPESTPTRSCPESPPPIRRGWSVGSDQVGILRRDALEGALAAKSTSNSDKDAQRGIRMREEELDFMMDHQINEAQLRQSRRSPRRVKADSGVARIVARTSGALLSATRNSLSAAFAMLPKTRRKPQTETPKPSSLNLSPEP